MTPHAPRPRPLAARLVLTLLAALLVAGAVACSDAPTAKEIEKADDGIDPSIVPIFTSDALLPVVQQLGTVFLIDHAGTTFQYTAKESDVLSQRVRDGYRPALWIDLDQVLEPFTTDTAARGPAQPMGNDTMQFVVSEEYEGPNPTLEVFGSERSPARTGLCETAAPCGAAAEQILADEGITPAPDNVYPAGINVIAALKDNQIDAALIYRSDATRLFTRLRFFPLPDPDVAVRTYETLRLRDDAIGEEFQSWIATSPEADSILVKWGYRPRPGRTT
jgi:molybdate transport system substrate-binding protein